jgi:carboxyl-terminal processing protease
MKTWRWPIITGLATLVFAMACASLPRLSLNRPTPAPTALPTPDAAARHLKVFTAIWEAVRDQYVRPDYDGVDWQKVGDTYRAKVEAGLDEDTFAQTMRAMLAELPQGQARFETRAERLEAQTADTSHYEGIGVFYGFRATPEPHIVVLAVIADSPAEKSGLQAHDSIYAVDSQPVQADEADTIINRIRGPADSSVTVTVQSPAGKRRDMTIQRGQISVTNTLSSNYVPSLGIAYYRVPVLADANTAQQIGQHLASLDPTALKGVILDLRIAHSGVQGWPLGDMLTLFGNGELGEFYGRTDTQTVKVEGQDVGGSQKAPLVILIGPDTEGSPEIFAGALQGAKRAKLIGLPTTGAIEAFSEIPLPDGSRLFLATSSFRTPDGTDLARSGLAPDLGVKEDWDMLSDDNDAAVEAAVKLLLSR